MDKDTWIIIPAYNEEKHISSVIKATKKLYDNIAVVDDGSKDNTHDISFQTGVWVLKNIVNMGKGAALKTGCDFAIKKGAKNIVVMDSDGQHKPSDISRLLKELQKTDIVFTYRSFSKKMPFVFRLGNYVINKSTRLLYGINLKDTQSGFRAFTSEAYKKIRWKSTNYSMESEMIARAGKSHLDYKEIPIATIYKDKYKGTTMIDGIKILKDLLIWKFTG